MTVVNLGRLQAAANMIATTLTWSQDNNQGRRRPQFVAGTSWPPIWCRHGKAPTGSLSSCDRTVTTCSYHKSNGHIGDAVRPGLVGRYHVPPSRRDVIPAHPYSTTSEYALRCSSSCTTAARDTDGARRTPRYDQRILADRTDQGMHFARGSRAVSNAHGS